MKEQKRNIEGFLDDIPLALKFIHSWNLLKNDNEINKVLMKYKH